jgi:hypothetical protein
MANDVDPEILMNAVMGKIADTLLNGDGETVPKSDDHYLAFIGGGIPMLEDSFNYALEGFGGVTRKNVDPENPQGSLGPQENAEDDDSSEELAEDARRKYAAAESFAALCDLIPDTSGIVDAGRINTWQPESRVSHAYALALQFSQVYNVEPDAETEAKIERWRGLLQKTVVEEDLVTGDQIETLKETELVKKYREKMLAYYGEVMAYNTTRVAALSGQDQQAVHNFALNGPLMQMKVRAAENDWISNGYRDQVDRINAAISAVEGRSFALLKQRYREDFFRSLLTSPNSGANFAYTAPTPPDFARGEAGWSEFHFDSGSFHSDFKFNSISTKAGGMLSLGFINVGGTGGVQKEDKKYQFNSQKFSFKCKLARVPIYRPAINMAFVTSGFWRFDQNNDEYRNTLLSDGKRPPNGLMPAITTDCVFIKDLELVFGDASGAHEEMRSQVNGGGGISWGPFHFGASHTSSSQSGSNDYEFTEQGLKVHGLQLIAFLCWALPQCPKPNPKVDNWI